jgi:putative membrane protein
LNKLEKQLHLDSAARDRIAAAVLAAEQKTSGEIVLAATRESARYSFWELLAAVLLSAAFFSALLPAAGAVTALFSRLFWDIPSWYVPAFYGVTSFGIIALGFIAANIPAVDRIVIPRRVRSTCVTNRALRYFTESGTANTREHSGILIFISLLERQVRIVADSGISVKIDQGLWTIIADSLADGIGSGNTEQAVMSAIDQCGSLLAQYFPAEADNPDELADGLVLLEDAEWN